MTPIQAAEVAVIKFVANELQTNEAAIEADLGPVEVVVVNDGIKLADEAFAKLPFGTAALVDALFNQYASKYFTPAELNVFVGIGLSKAVAFFNDLAAKLSA